MHCDKFLNCPPTSCICFGATGPTGPTGPEFSSTLINVELVQDTQITIPNGDNIRFNSIRTQKGNISYNIVNGIFTITEAGYYLINYILSTDGTETSPSITFVIRVNGTIISEASTPVVTGQLTGTAIIQITSVPATLSLNNGTGDTINLAAVPAQAEITIARISSL